MEKISFPESVTKPLVCRDRDDFTKYFFSLARIYADQNDGMTKAEDIEFFIDSIKYILHEYLALVLNGKLEPYDMTFGSKEDEEECVKEFREGMMETTMCMIKSGVPFKECDDGRSHIMFDKLKEEFEHGED